MNPLHHYLAHVADQLKLALKHHQTVEFSAEGDAETAAGGAIAGLIDLGNRVGALLDVTTRQQFLERAGL